MFDTTRNGAVIQNLEYEFDAVGNLKSRCDYVSSTKTREVFAYDPPDRLTSATLTLQNGLPVNIQTQTLALPYDRLGNICRKTPLGVNNDYTYLGAAGCGTGGLPGGAGLAAKAHAVGAVCVALAGRISLS